MFNRNGIVTGSAGPPPALISPAITELTIRRADKLRQLVRLRRAIFELEEEYLRLAGEERDLGMQLDHLEAAESMSR